MAILTFDTTYILEQLAFAIYGLRTEIFVFLVAFYAHAMLFGKCSVFKKDAKRERKTLTGDDRSKADTTSRKAIQKSDTNTSSAADDICKGCRGNASEVAVKLRGLLEENASQDSTCVLSGLLQSARRSVPIELLDAVRVVLRDQNTPLSMELGELLLRGYYSHHSGDRFDEVLAELEDSTSGQGDIDVGVGLQALKGSLRKGDFEASLTRLATLRRLWSADDKSPSSTPKALIQWLSRLATQQDKMLELLRKLQELKLLEEVFDLVLAECVQCGSMRGLQMVEAFARSEKIAFTDATYVSLLKGAQSEKAAVELFAETIKTSSFTKELLIAAAEAASATDSEALAKSIVKNLPAVPPGEVVTRLLQLAKKAGGHAKALDLYTQSFSKLDLSNEPTSERIITEACIVLKRLDVLQRMLNTSDESSKRVPLLKQLGAENRLDDAFVVFRAVPDKSACLYNALIDACIDGKKPDAAREVMEQAFEAGVADTVTYNTIIKAHLLAGNRKEARKAVELMKKAGFQPNCVTFNELLDACVKSDSKEVWMIIDEMDACGVKPNHITCSILLKTIDSNSAATNVERILKVLDSMSDEMDEVLLSSVVEACIRVGRVDLLMPYLKRQGSSRRIQVRGPHTYGSIIRAYGFVEDIAGAWEAWREMRTRHIVPTAVTLGCMVEAVVSNGDPEAGYELIQEMLNDEQCCSLVNAVIYCSVVKGFSHQKKFDRVWTVYQEMLVQKVQFSIVTFNTLVDACSRSAEMNRIPGLLESMVSQGIEPNLITYSAILKGYCQENRLDEAFKLMDGMVQTTRFKPDEIMYNTLLDGCARQGLYDRGVKLLGEMEKVGVRPSNFTLSVLVKMASRAKRLDQAFDLAEQISSKYRFRLNIHVYSNLIQACILNKDLQRAFEVLERLAKERVRPDVRTYSLLLKASVAAGEAADAAGLIRAAVGLRGVHPRLMGADAKLLQPPGGLPPALLSEVLEGISGPQCRDEGLAVVLLKDLRTKPNVKLDPRLQLRLTAHAMGTKHRQQ